MILNIDGRDLPAEPGDTLLAVARRHGLSIPTLCYHEGLEAWGGCRLCVVEMRRPGSDEVRVVPSCLQPAEEGLRVQTATERLRGIRAVLLDLLLARAPEAEPIRRLALEHGVARTGFVARIDPDKCILCSICIRACEKIGAHAIATAGRGAAGKVTLPFGEDASACVGCGACALSCPTGAIPLEDVGATRTLWGRRFERIRCSACGRPTLTREHAAHLAARTGLPDDTFAVCDACRRERAGQVFASFQPVRQG